MANDPIKYNGIANELPEAPQYFAQVSIPETLVIPSQKPNMEQIVSITVEPVVEAMKIIDTPCIKSHEGQFLSGKKLVVELKLIEKLVYVACEPSQSVHAAHYENTFKSVFIIIPKVFNETTVEDLLRQGKILVKPYVEDIYAEQRDCRTIFKNITLLLDATFACSC